MPRATAFNNALMGSKRCPDGGGSRQVPQRRRNHDSTPNGTCALNSQGHDPTDMIAAATDGPAADDAATTSTL